MRRVTIYTDGACSGNPGPGGYGAILMYKNHKKEISGYEKDTTNNRMEMTAAIKALEMLTENCAVEVYTDSAYLCDAFTKNWVAGWQRKNWMTAAKEPVKNKDLWLELIELGRKHDVTYIKVKGHSDNEFNNRCDELATGAIKSNR